MQNITTTGFSFIFFRVCIIFAFIVVPGCKNQSNTPATPPPTDCSLESQNQYVFDLMKDFYFWYTEVPEVDPTLYASPEALLEALKYAPLDRFSGISEQQSYNSFLGQGQYIGIGLRLMTDDTNRLFVALSYTGSPAENAGITRGTEIIAINGYLVSTLLTGADYDMAWGDTSLGTTADLDILLPGANATSSVTLTREVITIDSTQFVNTFTDGNGVKFGYLLFTNFFGGGTSTLPLDNAFNYFKTENINQLILDLRYNGGGAVNTANHLGNLVGGTMTENNIFSTLLYSDRYSHFNRSSLFKNIEESISLNKIYIITTAATCSASEMLINSLDPHIEVVLIGGTTCGKPVGFNPQGFCEKVISAVNFEFRNSLNQGAFYNGITATCSSNDDLSQTLGSPQENAVAIASYYQQHNQCTAPAAALAKPVQTWREAEPQRTPYKVGIY